MKKRLQTIIAFLLIIGNYASAQPEKVVKDFGEAMSSWCSTNNILYRKQIDALCSGPKSCRVEDKIHADYQKKRGLTNYETFVLDSYMNMFQTFMAQNIQFRMSNVKLGATDMMPDGELSFVTADIKVSGPLNYIVTDLFLVREGKITGIYSYSSQLGFSHLNGSLIRALKIGRYSYDYEMGGYSFNFLGEYAVIRNEVGKYGIIDIRGDIIIPCIWDFLLYLSEDGFVIACKTYKKDNLFKVYDLRLKGKVIPGFSQYKTLFFRNGFMRVWNGEHWGYLREDDFEYNVEFRYDNAEDFFDGYALVEIDKKKLIIDSTFKVIYESNDKYEIISSFHQELAKVKDKQTNKYGFINLKGQLVIPCIFRDADDFSEGLCAVYNDIGYNAFLGFINKNGKVVIPVEFEANDKWDNKYMKRLHMFKDGYINVKKNINGRIYETLIEINGKPLPGFGWVYEKVSPFKEGFAKYKLNGKYGFLNKKGQVVVPAKYEYATDFHNGYASVQMNVDGTMKWGCINHDGVEVVPCIYDNRTVIENGIALVSLGGKIGLIDVYGNSIFVK